MIRRPRGAARALRCELNLINVVRQLGTYLETFLRAHPFLFYHLYLLWVRDALSHSTSEYILELFVDALKMSLEIIGGSLYEVFEKLKALGCDRSFATNQDK
jgi:hypothetical protein